MPFRAGQVSSLPGNCPGPLKVDQEQGYHIWFKPISPEPRLLGIVMAPTERRKIFWQKCRGIIKLFYIKKSGYD